MNMDMKRDLGKIVALMRKAYSEVLQGEEQKKFEQLLKDKHLRDVYSEVGDDAYLEKHFARYEKYSPEKAYEIFERNRRRDKKRFVLRRVAVAACFILPLLGLGVWMMMQEEKQESPVVLAKKESVQLKLSDGRVVDILQGNEIKEEGG